MSLSIQKVVFLTLIAVAFSASEELQSTLSKIPDNLGTTETEVEDEKQKNDSEYTIEDHYLEPTPQGKNENLDNTLYYAGTVTDKNGTPVSGTLEVTVQLYKDSDCPEPIVSETVSVDVEEGQVEVIVGLADPVPTEILEQEEIIYEVQVKEDDEDEDEDEDEDKDKKEKEEKSKEKDKK